MKKNYAFFLLKKRVSELLHNVNRWAKIFATEKEDRTNKKHRKHIKEMLPYLNGTRKICIFFIVQKEGKFFAGINPDSLKADLNKN